MMELQAATAGELGRSLLEKQMIGPRVIVVESRLHVPSPFGRGEIVTYRYFETVSCPDQGRWSAFLKALTSQLSNSGLGSLSDQATSNDDAATGDLLIELRNLDYGRALLEQCVRTNQIAIERPLVPQRWIDYRCDEYFADNWWSPAKYDRESHLWAGIPESHLWNGILDYTRMYEDLEHRFLAIAGSGCDGIDFGYRQQCEGLWAYYPGEDYFKLMAPTIPALRDGWCGGVLRV